MFSEERLFNLNSDLAKQLTVSSVQDVGDSFILGNDLLSTRFITTTVASLVGIVVYHLIVSERIQPETGNEKLNVGLQDALKMITILFISQTINTGLKGDIDYNDEWIQSTLVSGGSLVAFHTLVADMLPKVEGKQKLIMDLGKVTFSTMMVQYMSGGDIVDMDYLISLIVTLIGFVVYHELVVNVPRLY